MSNAHGTSFRGNDKVLEPGSGDGWAPSRTSNTPGRYLLGGCVLWCVNYTTIKKGTADTTYTVRNKTIETERERERGERKGFWGRKRREEGGSQACFPPRPCPQAVPPFEPGSPPAAVTIAVPCGGSATCLLTAHGAGQGGVRSRGCARGGGGDRGQTAPRPLVGRLSHAVGGC